MIPSSVSDGGKIEYIQLVDAQDEIITGDVPGQPVPQKRREVLTRRPSYRKILNELSDSDMGEYKKYILSLSQTQ